MAVHTGIYEVWLAFRHQGRSPHEMFIRTMESKIDQMKREVEREGRREERRKQFERMTGHKLEDAETDERRSAIDFILKRHPSLEEDGPSPNTTGGLRSPPPLNTSQVPSPGGAEGLQTPSPFRGRRLSEIFRPKSVVGTPGGHAADGNGIPTGAIDLEMGPLETGNRLIDRRARGERVHPVIDEEQRTRASRDGVQDGTHR